MECGPCRRERSLTMFHGPVDRIRAYLFEPSHNPGTRLAAMVAIHQDGPQSHMGKLETAGLAGDKNISYGLELFQQGYVVLCARIESDMRNAAVAWSRDRLISSDLDLLNYRVGRFFYGVAPCLARKLMTVWSQLMS